jgi:hypothetical protein
LISLDAQIELLKRLGSLQRDPLVAALRDLHTRGEAGAWHLHQLLVSARPVPSRSIAAPDQRTPIERTRGVDYERARRHFVDHSRRLREQAILAERLLEAFVRRQDTTPPSALQHELRMMCARGSTASADFIVVNREASAMDVRFDAARSRGRDADGTEIEDGIRIASALSFDPATVHLLPGQEAVVRLSLDLRGDVGRAHTLDVAVDVRGGDRLLLRLWIHVQVTEAKEDAS